MNHQSANYKAWLGSFIFIFILLLSSCAGSSPASDNNKVTGTISGWNQTNVTLDAVVEGPEPLSLSSGTMTAKGEFDLTLPAVDATMLGPIQQCAGVTVNPSDTKFVSTYYLEAHQGNSLLGRVYYASALVSQEPVQGVTLQGVAWVYVNNDVSVKGTCADVFGGQSPFPFILSATVDATLKKGWNKVLIRLENSTESQVELSFSTKAIPTEVKWLFDASYGLPNFKFKLALWLGLRQLQAYGSK